MNAPAAAHWPSEHKPMAWRYFDGCRHADCREAVRVVVTASSKRAAERARQDPSLVPHGTRGGYEYWRCRCGKCREARRFYQGAAIARRKQREGRALTDWDREVLELAATP